MADVVVTYRHGTEPDDAARAGAGADVDMGTSLAGLRLPAPVLTASGCSGMGRELAPFCDLTALGAVVTKSVMVAPRAGRPTPRMAETPSGMLNSIGLQGPGVEAFCEYDLPWLADRGVRTVVSIAGESVDEYARLARRLRGEPGVSAVEVNISCPNVANRGLVFACQPATAAEVTAAVHRADPGVPVLVKLSPDVTDLVAVAAAVVDAGADGLTLINTLLGMAVDPRTLRPTLAGGTGGLSGPAIHPVAVRAVHQVHAALPDVPILGVGGVASGWDALELVAAGASAVSVGTATFGDPSAPSRVLAELRSELACRGIRRFTDAVGLAHRPGPDGGAAPVVVAPGEPG
jgi:dihydroorotate dehydrogenase (NAD+) catalytic subunit